MLKVGHRGASGHEPENTLLSFKKAVELGVDMIELDVHLSKDNELIVIHDDTLNRTTTGKGKISQKTLEEIKKYKTKKKNQPIPTLKEVFAELKRKIKINIEIKGKKPTLEVTRLVKAFQIEKEVVISSNYVKCLKVVKEVAPEVKTALIYFAAKNPFRQIIFGLFSILIFPLTKWIILKRANRAVDSEVNLFFPFATKNVVNQLHQKGFKVNVWSVNQRFFIKQMVKRKVDGIFSNYPDRLLNINS